jgi:hypothetical protein
MAVGLSSSSIFIQDFDRIEHLRLGNKSRRVFDAANDDHKMICRKAPSRENRFRSTSERSAKSYYTRHRALAPRTKPIRALMDAAMKPPCRFDCVAKANFSSRFNIQS